MRAALRQKLMVVEAKAELCAVVRKPMPVDKLSLLDDDPLAGHIVPPVNEAWAERMRDSRALLFDATEESIKSVLWLILDKHGMIVRREAVKDFPMWQAYLDGAR